MIYRATKEQIEEYKASPNLNQSKLKLLAEGVQKFNEAATEEQAEAMFYKEAGHFIIGSGVDTLLTGTEEMFEEEYYVSDTTKPSDAIMSIVQMAFSELNREAGSKEDMPQTLQDSLTFNGVVVGDTALWRAIERHSYCPTYKADTRIERLIKEGSSYYEDLLSSLGKTVLSIEQYTTIKLIGSSFRESDMTGNLFRDIENVDTYYQLPIYFIYKDVEMKALLDILQVNHKEKKVRVTDVKTLFDVPVKFPISARARRYDIQQVVYEEAVLSWMQEQGLTDAGYTLVSPQFAVETTSPGKQGFPLIFRCTGQFMNVGLYGRKSFSAVEIKHIKTHELSYEYKGFIELIELYKWHLEHGFHQDKKIQQSGGFLDLTWEGV